jgi:hypothetical protein
LDISKKRSIYIYSGENKEKTSQYKGVTWHSKIKKWYAQLPVKGGKTKYGGTFDNELEAAKRVNQLCEELSFPQQNPTVSAIPDEKYQVTRNFFCLNLSFQFFQIFMFYNFKLFTMFQIIFFYQKSKFCECKVKK